MDLVPGMAGSRDRMRTPRFQTVEALCLRGPGRSSGHGLWPRPVKWCTRLSASSSPDVYAAAAIAITSSGSSTGSASALVIDSALM